jgi:hypothetical protein
MQRAFLTLGLILFAATAWAGPPWKTLDDVEQPAASAGSPARNCDPACSERTGPQADRCGPETAVDRCTRCHGAGRDTTPQCMPGRRDLPDERSMPACGPRCRACSCERDAHACRAERHDARPERGCRDTCGSRCEGRGCRAPCDQADCSGRCREMGARDCEYRGAMCHDRCERSARPWGDDNERDYCRSSMCGGCDERGGRCGSQMGRDCGHECHAAGRASCMGDRTDCHCPRCNHCRGACRDEQRDCRGHCERADGCREHGGPGMQDRDHDGRCAGRDHDAPAGRPGCDSQGRCQQGADREAPPPAEQSRCSHGMR